MRNLGWLAAALALATAACGGSSKGGGSPADLGAHVDCAWFAGSNCWRQAAAAATACTDGSATGTFNAATTTCTYADGNVVQFDPSASATASYNQDVPWDFAVVTSTAAQCARFVESNTTLTLTTSLGVFQESYDDTNVAITCPDGTRYWTELDTAWSCPWTDLPGSVSSGVTSISFALLGAPSTDAFLWKCR